MEFREVATGLKFPEGPVAMDDGSIILVEIAERQLQEDQDILAAAYAMFRFARDEASVSLF